LITLGNPGRPIGIGEIATGVKLEKIKIQIIDYIDNQLIPPMCMATMSETTPIKLPKFKLNQEEMKHNYQDMNDPNFWLQQAIKKEIEGHSATKLEDANVFYRQGIRITPDALILMFNLARNSLKLCKYEQALKWWDYALMIHPRWVNALTGMAITYLQMGYYVKANDVISAAKDNIKGAKSDIDTYPCLFKPDEI